MQTELACTQVPTDEQCKEEEGGKSDGNCGSRMHVMFNPQFVYLH